MANERLFFRWDRTFVSGTFQKSPNVRLKFGMRTKADTGLTNLNWVQPMCLGSRDLTDPYSANFCEITCKFTSLTKAIDQLTSYLERN
jgi:hypothetical protein